MRPEARLEFLIDKRKPFLCTEDVVDKVAHVGMWHCRISVSAVRFADYLFCSSIDPSDKSLGYFHGVRFADSYRSTVAGKITLSLAFEYVRIFAK